MKKFNLFLLSVFVFFFVIDNASSQSRFEVGTEFPKIKLPALDGSKSLSIENFRGHKVILHIFASW